MYCVLLVDDEQIILNTLLTSIPWQQLGVDQVLTASDGNAALTLIRNSSVDLLISDIKILICFQPKEGRFIRPFSS